MLIRIVRMHFTPETVPAFLQTIWEPSRPHIAAMPGCFGVELKRDPADANVYYTFSRWADEAALNAYRDSELFGSVWPATKALFAAKAQAFSLVD